MKCPTCGENTPDAWRQLYPSPAAAFSAREMYLDGGQASTRCTWVDWMNCANPDCGELVIRIHEGYDVGGDQIQQTASWIARPRTVRRPVDSLVPEQFRRDYEEAAAILDLSPRMSAVLSRRILGDLLEKYDGQDQFSLTTRIDKFVANSTHPRALRENLHHFREIADFGAHTQKDDQAEVIDVDREEAEWTLDLVDRLFDYFILSRERDRRIRAAMDAKIAAAGRKPISPLPDEPPSDEGK